jgi:hypothetical protein
MTSRDVLAGGVILLEENEHPGFDVLGFDFSVPLLSEKKQRVRAFDRVRPSETPPIDI